MSPHLFAKTAEGHTQKQKKSGRFIEDMMKRKRKTQKRGTCIFCGGAPLSKEHVFSDWLLDVLPRAERHSQLASYFSMDYATKTLVSSDRLVDKQGSILRSRLRIVCESCNNGWMSRNVAQSKDIVDVLVGNRATQVRSDQLICLSAWVATMTVIAEFTDLRSAAIPKSDRGHLYLNHSPPAHWIISIGRYTGETLQQDPVRYRHHGFSLSKALIPGSFDPKTAIPIRLQLSNFTVGHLFIQVMSSTDQEQADAFRRYHVPNGLTVIWPATPSILGWNALPTMNDVERDSVADNFARALIRQRPPQIQ